MHRDGPYRKGGERFNAGGRARPSRLEVIPAPGAPRWLEGRNANQGERLDARRMAETALPPLPEPGPHLLRVLEGAVVDFPAPVLHREARQWAATCWPDAAQPGGWARALWWTSPYGRGYLPVALDYADVVEFAADIPVRQRWTTRWWPVRWYGVVVEESPRGLVVYGPYPNPGAAKGVADELRCTLAYYYAARPRS